jgi:septal ring factor EnvC (AmiA/AmiB activator)
MQIAELESNTNALHDKFEAALAHLEQEAEDKDEEIAIANREIEQLGHRIYELEEDAEELKRINDRARDDEMVERERLEALTAALKEVRGFAVVPVPPFDIFAESSAPQGRVAGSDRSLRRVQPRYSCSSSSTGRTSAARRGPCRGGTKGT